MAQRLIAGARLPYAFEFNLPGTLFPIYPATQGMDSHAPFKPRSKFFGGNV